MSHVIYAMGDVRSSHGCVRDIDKPAPTITSSADNGNFRFLVTAGVTGEGRPRRDDKSAPTMTSKGTAYWLMSEDQWRAEPANPGDPPHSTEWAHRRPAVTVVGSFAPDVMAAPGWRKPGDGPRQKAKGSIRITVQEAGILQGFPADWIWPPTKGKGFMAAGNAVCPPVQKAMCEELLRSAA